MEWYKQSREDLLNTLDTDINKGLVSSEVDLRLGKYGSNELIEAKTKGFLSKIIATLISQPFNLRFLTCQMHH